MESTSQSRPRWVPLLLALLGVALVAGGGYALRQDILVHTAARQHTLNTALASLTDRLAHMETNIHTLAAPPEPPPLTALTQQLDDVTAQMTALTARIEALEHQLAAAPPAAQPAAPAAPLHESAILLPDAPTITSPAARMAEFHRIVDDLPPPPLADSAFLSQLNQRFNGLIRVHKSTGDPYAPLRQAQDIAAARAAIAALPETERAPFSGWLEKLNAEGIGAY